MERAFLVILTSRMDEFANLRNDLHARLARGRQERFAAKLTWEAIQRIELCDRMPAMMRVLRRIAIVICLAVLGWAAYWYFNSGKASQPQQTQAGRPGFRRGQGREAGQGGGPGR